jgi:uncharacterized membrane protein
MQNPPPVQVSSQPPATVAKSSTGLDENIAALLSYIFGWVSGLIFFLIEKDSRLVRFHAMQSIITFGGLSALSIVLTWVPIIGSSTSLWLAVTVLALLAIYRRRRRNREIEERWAKEEEDDDLEH